MFIAIARPAVEPIGPDAVAVPYAPQVQNLNPRALQRRLRGLERKRADRPEDADYWLQAAPVAIRKACALREERSFAPLP